MQLLHLGKSIPQFHTLKSSKINIFHNFKYLFLCSVKSLHSGGVGDIFEEVPRVTLSDLQNQLKAVKTLRKSFEG